MSKLKISWGTKIAFLYGGFMLLIISLVWGSMRQSTDLVSDDYYQQELKYQDVINAGKNQAGLSAPITITPTAGTLRVNFPSEFNNTDIRGNIEFYSEAHAAWDRQFPISTTANEVFIPREGLRQTIYKVKISWTANNKDYFQESILNLNK